MRKIEEKDQPFLSAHLFEKRNAELHRQSSSAYEALFRLHGEMLGDAPVRRILYQMSGKPYFEGGYPYFSLSHTEGMSLAVMSLSFEVGADIESLQAAREKGKASAYRALAERMFFREELETLSVAATDEEFLSAFLSVYTQKEALAKLLTVPVMQINTQKPPKEVSVETTCTDCGAYIYSVAFRRK